MSDDVLKIIFKKYHIIFLDCQNYLELCQMSSGDHSKVLLWEFTRIHTDAIGDELEKSPGFQTRIMTASSNRSFKQQDFAEAMTSCHDCGKLETRPPYITCSGKLQNMFHLRPLSSIIIHYLHTNHVIAVLTKCEIEPGKPFLFYGP